MKIRLTTKKGNLVQVSKESTDPLCLRASIGGTSGQGYYCVFRGDNWDEVEEMLTETLEAFKEAKKRHKTQNN